MKLPQRQSARVEPSYSLPCERPTKQLSTLKLVVCMSSSKALCEKRSINVLDSKKTGQMQRFPSTIAALSPAGMTDHHRSARCPAKVCMHNSHKARRPKITAPRLYFAVASSPPELGLASSHALLRVSGSVTFFQMTEFA